MRIYQKEGVIDMATRTLTQSNLNNNMSGNTANALYYATHGGTGNAPVVTGKNNSGNYTTSSGGTTTYHFAGPVETSTGGTAIPQDPTDPTSPKGGTTSNGGSYNGSYDSSAYGYGGGGGYNGIDIEGLIAQQRAAAQNAYDNSMARLENAWNINEGALRSNLDSTLNRLKSQYDFSEGRAQSDADKSLREAYINYMMNKKNLAQGLSAMGMSGGATESSMAKLFNNYGSSRNNINTTLADNLANLLNEYQGNVSNAQQLYNSQRADAWNQRMAQQNSLEASLANALTNLYTGNNLSQYANYASTLANLAATPSFNNGGYAMQLANINNTGEFTPTQNTLATDLVNTTANNNMGSVTDYAKWKAMADSLSGQGAKPNDIIYEMMNNGADANVIRSVFGY